MKKRLPILIFVFVIAVFLYFNRDSIFTKNYLGDLHMHTTCSDGNASYEEMIEAAVKAKLDFVAITDHNNCSEVEAKCKAETKLLCIPGREITEKNTHLLSLNTRGGIKTNLPLLKQVEEIHRQGGIAIAAHPNAVDFYYSDDELANSKIDAQECTGDSAERRFLPCVFDSDAHEALDLAWQYNSCIGPIENFEDLKTAILSKKCSRAITLPLLSIEKAKNY
jgi:hypothetical protein